MSYKSFLARVAAIFSSDQTAYLDSITSAFADKRLSVPVQPMSDSELAAALREFTNAPPSDDGIEALNSRFKGGMRDR